MPTSHLTTFTLTSTSASSPTQSPRLLSSVDFPVLPESAPRRPAPNLVEVPAPEIDLSVEVCVGIAMVEGRLFGTSGTS